MSDAAVPAGRPGLRRLSFGRPLRPVTWRTHAKGPSLTRQPLIPADLLRPLTFVLFHASSRLPTAPDPRVGVAPGPLRGLSPTDPVVLCALLRISARPAPVHGLRPGSRTPPLGLSSPPGPPTRTQGTGFRPSLGTGRAGSGTHCPATRLLRGPVCTGDSRFSQRDRRRSARCLPTPGRAGRSLFKPQPRRRHAGPAAATATASGPPGPRPVVARSVQVRLLSLSLARADSDGPSPAQ